MGFLELICYIVLLNWIEARPVHIVPKFFGQDSSIVIDTDKPLPVNLSQKLLNALYNNYQVYHLIKQQKEGITRGSISNISAPKVTANIEALQLKSAIINNEEILSDLSYIARRKMGLKRFDQLPSVNALCELLGTVSIKETINFIKDLTTTEQGLAAIKSYIECVNYAYRKSENELDEEERVDKETAKKKNADGNNVQYDNFREYKSNTTSKNPDLTELSSHGFLQSFTNNSNLYSLWHLPTVPLLSTTLTAAPTGILPRFEVNSYVPLLTHSPPQLQSSSRGHKKPPLVLQPLPYHYPVAIHPLLVKSTVHSMTLSKQVTNSAVPLNSAVPQAKKPTRKDLGSKVVSTIPNLNTPIMQAVTKIAPHVQHLAKSTNISPLKLDRFLQSKPKLAELALRFNSFNGGIPTDQHVVAAVQNAIDHDDQLKKLLASVEKLK